MTKTKRSGTQSVERAMALVKLIAERNVGWRISSLAEFCGLDISTTHRILASLVRERFIQQRTEDRRYVLGPLISELALTRPLLPDLRPRFVATMEPIAKRAGAASFLYVRSGNEYVVAAQTGPLKTGALVGQVGSRRPLAWTAGGIAILMALPAEEASIITRENLKKIGTYGGTRLKWTRQMIRESRQSGFAINSASVTGMNVYAVPIIDGANQPVAAVSLAVSVESHPPNGGARIIRTLQGAAHQIARECMASGNGKPELARRVRKSARTTRTRK
jgi:DNA-binding IclR family transcriptional regulator